MKSASENRRAAAAGRDFDVERIREDFPILRQRVRGKPLVYLDNAATTQKPRSVIERLDHYYRAENANIHRGVHFLSELATQQYEEARRSVQRFLNAAEPSEIIFVRGTTEGINLVAHSYGRANLKAGDEVLITEMEHHSNIVPWQILCREVGARLQVAPIDDHGEIRLEEFRRKLSPKTKLVSVTHVSNALGTINPVKEMIALAHGQRAVVVVDGAQAVPHFRVDVRDLDCDFYAFSGHKLFGPTGIGALYGKKALLEEMPPYQGGGDMISSVTFEKTLYNVLPYKFEAGTPHIAGGIGLGAAIAYVEGIGFEAIEAHERQLMAHATERLAQIKGLRLIGTAKRKAGVLSFVLEGVHAHDVGTILDQEGIAIRTGHHCCMPLMRRFGVPATARASLAFYNTTEEIDALARAIPKVLEVFG
ncbi:MAG TPA: cysteine desulfurase [Candidatus Acidoferrales bacterium]|nr:cysteine desulfurase [Candidatus Acidoferrales bacterium]